MKRNKSIFNRIYLIRMDSRVLRESGGHPRHFSPPFTLKYIQALAIKNRDFRVKLVDCLVNPLPLEKLINNVLAWNPDLLIVSSSTHSYESAIQFCSLVKEERDILAIAIGQGPTVHFSDYSFSAPSFDIVLRGEAEQEAISLLKNLNNGMNEDEVKDFYRCELSKGGLNLARDLDSLPFPEYTPSEIRAYQYLYPLRVITKIRWGHILSSRGCHHSCVFCSQIIRETYDNKMRWRSPANVIDEIEYLMARGVNVISFDDDNFSASQKHIAGICAEILQRKLKFKWIAHSRIDELNVSLIKLMKEAGCILLRFGIESASGRIIRILNKNKSNINWIETGKNILGCCRKVGIATNALFMIGNPTETAEEIKDTIKMAKALDPDLIQVHLFTPYPGSMIYENLRALGINKNDLSHMHHYDFPEVDLSEVCSSDLIRMRGMFYRSFMLNPFFLLKHLFRYFLFYINNIECAFVFFGFLKIVFQRKEKSRPRRRGDSIV